MKRRRRSSLEYDEQQETLSKTKKRRKSTLDSWDVPAEIYCKTELCHKLFEAMRNFKDKDNHLLCEFVARAPNRRSVPEYYKIVSHPIDLIKIQQKLKTDEYISVPLFLSDVQLLIDNAKSFYKPLSVEYKRTVALEKQFLKTLQELSSSEGELDSPLSPKTVSLKLSSLSLPEKVSKASSAPSATSSLSKKPAVKTTRSKAWLDEYASSNDPIKIFFADVYSYHDNTGEYIAQPFIDLPSRKDYPEYYRVITEPIGLTNIKSQIDAGYYCNLKAIQDDLFLMVKNAQYFNEPQSDIYKMAVVLRKFIISRCMELERKFKTVEKSIKTKSPSPATTGGHEKRPDTESESDGLTCSDSDEESETEGKRKLLLRIKRNSFSTKKDPLAKVLKARSLPPLKKIFLAIYRTLTSSTDEQGRVISELFLKRPSAKLYPEYYVIIKAPIDFKEIYSKIKHDVYKSLSEMMDDVELLVNNAITFNEEYSQIHTDALALRGIAQTASNQLQSKWPLTFTGTGRKVHAIQTGTSAISTLFAVIKNCIDSTGRKLWLSLKETPPPSREGDTYCGGRKPVGLMIIAQKVESNSYSSVDDLFDDLCYLFECYCEFYPIQNPCYKDSVSLHRVSVTKYNELTNERRACYHYPDVPEAIKKLMKELMNRLVECKDTDGHTLRAFFNSVVVTQEFAEEEKPKRIFTFEKLFQWVMHERYSRLDQLQADIILLFKEVRSKEHEQMEDSIKLSLFFEKQYIFIRDDIFGQVLQSPAFNERTQQQIEDEETELNEDFEEMETRPIAMPSLNERSLRDMYEIDDVIYRPGDFVYLPPRESHLPPQIVLIETLWTDSHEKGWFDGCWFFRPHETFHVASRKFYQQEVFKSDFYSSAQLASVTGKCYILFVKDYVKLYPKGFSEEDVYVCESRYVSKTKSFKKIKSWNIQQNQHVPLLPRLTPCTLNKVPSVFATDADKSVEQETMMDQDVTAKTETEEDIESTSSGSLERSFFRDLKEVTVSVSNPEENCVYFQQYCIDDKIFKLGDFVYVRSDQELPFIARIDRMWTDINDDPWFNGPWFVRVKEVKHVPTRMFYEKELFMSNIKDTNPMRSIIRKCAVLYPSDYVKWRPTEIPEADVFVSESKYDEDEKLVRKMKSLKQYELNDSVLKDEKFFLSEDVFLWKCHSSQLYPQTSTVPVTPATTQASSPVIAVPTSFGQVTLSLQQIQSLLSINQAKIAQQNTTDTILAYPCVWEGCQEIFEDSIDLGSHIFKSNHLHAEVDGSYYCYWSQCPRNKDNAKPFDSLQKITRHVKEVHLLRVYPQKVPLVKMNSPSFHRRGVFMKESFCATSTADVQQIPPTSTHPSNTTPVVTPVNITPVQLAKAVKATVFQPNTPEATSSINPAFTNMDSVINPGLANATAVASNTPILNSVAPAPANMTPTATYVSPGLANLNQSINTSVTPVLSNVTPFLSSYPEVTAPTNSTVKSHSVFITPPTHQKEVIHSQIYMNYIERMRNNEDTISCLTPPTTRVQFTEAKASQWIDPSIIPDGLTPTEALYQLYHHMINDSVTISQWLDTVQ